MTLSIYDKIYKQVKKIPCGKVATYGQIAALCGNTRGARMVGWALNALNNVGPQTAIPWQRVINREGRISIVNKNATKDLQADLLRSEGVKVELRDSNYWVDLSKYLWHPPSGKS